MTKFAAFLTACALFSALDVINCASDGQKHKKEDHEVEKPYYTAGVVEYYPIRDNPDDVATVSGNANNYITIMETAAENNVDIIVFPENGLSSRKESISKALDAATPAPDPAYLEAPCDSTNNYPQYFRNLSCAARKHSIYVVFNIYEKAIGSVNESGIIVYKIYNTNIALDRNGIVIGRYRKVNLFANEIEIVSRPDEPELSYFETDFKVTFGMFTCFDILFESPALDLLRKLKIRDIAFPSHWFSEMPFLTALQYQSGFAYVNDVNLLGSGNNNPATASRGSGIYAGHQILVKYWSEEPSNVLLIANVPKVMENGQRDPVVATNAKMIEFSRSEIASIPEGLKGARVFLQEQLEFYKTEVYDPENKTSQGKRKVCHKEVCCEFEITSTYSKEKESSDYYRYRLAVYDGVRHFISGTAGAEVCALISCRNDTLDSCGHVYDENVASPITFTSVVISRTVEENYERNHSYVPCTMTTDTNLIPPEEFAFIIHNNRIRMYLKMPKNNVLTFGILGRNFRNDGKKSDYYLKAELLA